VTDRTDRVFTAGDLDRLRTLKRRYNLRNVFRVNNHNVFPD
jgi:hypothetical protein